MAGLTSILLISTIFTNLEAARTGNRQKRQLRGDTCPLQCMQGMYFRFHALGIHASSTGLIDPKLYEQRTANQFCREYRNGKGCIHRCDPSNRKSIVLNSLSPFNYLCNDHFHEFLGHTICFKKSAGAVKSICSRRCGGSEQLKSVQQHLEAAKQKRDLGRMSRLMGDKCRRLDCLLICQEQVVEQVCRDPAASVFMRVFVLNTLTSVKAHFHADGRSHLWPEACDKLVFYLPTSLPATLPPPATSRTILLDPQEFKERLQNDSFPSNMRGSSTDNQTSTQGPVSTSAETQYFTYDLSQPTEPTAWVYSNLVPLNQVKYKPSSTAATTTTTQSWEEVFSLMRPGRLRRPQKARDLWVAQRRKLQQSQFRGRSYARQDEGEDFLGLVDELEEKEGLMSAVNQLRSNYLIWIAVLSFIRIGYY